MGACFSTSKVCVGKPLKRSKKKAHNTSSVTDNHKKRKAIKNRVSSRLSDRPLYACNNNTNHVLKSTSFPDRYTSNPTYQG